MMAAPIPFADARERSPLLDVEHEHLPAILVDVEAGEIVNANAAGRMALALFPYASFPIALAPETQALTRLRQLTSHNATLSGESEPLQFWAKSQAQPTSWHISYCDPRRSGLLLLRIADPNAPPPTNPFNDEAIAKEPAAVPSDKPPDADKLKEIARQIRDDKPATDQTPENPQAPDGELPVAPLNGAATHVDNEKQDTPLATAHAAEVLKPPPSPGRKTHPVLDPDHLAKLAHELKTPLTAIAAAAEVMRDERLGEMHNKRYLSYAADIHESATHALDVISSLLSESGKPGTVASRLIALDLNAIAERTVSSVQALAQSRSLALAFHADGGRPHVVANPTAVRQILLNLLTNAIKFTPRGGDVRVATGYLEDGRVFLVVRDTGCGMKSPAALSEPASSDEAAQTWNKGSGIGLPLVRRLVHEMGADIEIDSAPGKGTVVLIAFGGYARWSE